MTNQEKFKTPSERHDGFFGFCREHATCKTCELGRKLANLGFNYGPDMCKYAWLDLEYEVEKKLLRPCPFCGGETGLNSGHLVQGKIHYWIDCISPDCMYRSKHFTDPDSAITEHNRVSDAVRDAK